MQSLKMRSKCPEKTKFDEIYAQTASEVKCLKAEFQKYIQLKMNEIWNQKLLAEKEIISNNKNNDIRA